MPADEQRDDDHGLLHEAAELPQELAGVAEAVREDLEATRAARWALRAYRWTLEHSPTSTRGKIAAAVLVVLIVLAPSVALLWVTLQTGQDATQSWFSNLGYAGVFLANLASTATVFIPVPGLTAAAQALIASSSDLLNPFVVGLLGGLGMAVGEVTAYVAGMAGSAMAREGDLHAPGRLGRIIERVVRWIDWLMARYGVPTLFVLAAVPNPVFEIAGLTAGATRMNFWKFMASVTPGKVVRGMLLAYIGEKIIFG